MSATTFGRLIDEYELLQPLYRDPTTNLTSVNDIVNVSFDGISILVFFVLLLLSLVLYLGKRSYRLIHIFCCWKTWRIRAVRRGESNKSKWQQQLRRYRWIYIVIHYLMVFLCIRIIHETLALVRDVLPIVDLDAEADLWAKHTRRVFDAVSMQAYFTLYSLIIPIWLYSALVWVSIDRHNRKRKVVSGVVYAFVVLLNIMTLITFVPLGASALPPLFGMTLAYMAHYDDIRRIFILSYVLPLEIIYLFTITVFLITFCVIIIRMVRSSLYLYMKGSRYVYDYMYTIGKLSLGMVVFTVCVGFRLVGFIIYAIPNLPGWVTSSLIRTLPDALFVLAVNLIFWPFRIPLLGCLGAPLAMAERIQDEHNTATTESLAYKDMAYEYDRSAPISIAHVQDPTRISTMLASVPAQTFYQSSTPGTVDPIFYAQKDEGSPSSSMYDYHRLSFDGGVDTGSDVGTPQQYYDTLCRQSTKQSFGFQAFNNGSQV